MSQKNTPPQSQKLRRTDVQMLKDKSIVFRGIRMVLSSIQKILEKLNTDAQNEILSKRNSSDYSRGNPRYAGQGIGIPDELQVFRDIKSHFEQTGIADIHYEQQKKDISDILTTIVQFSLQKGSPTQRKIEQKIREGTLTLSYKKDTMRRYILHIEIPSTTKYDQRLIQYIKKELMQSARMQDILNLNINVDGCSINNERVMRFCDENTEIWGRVNHVKDQIQKKGLEDTFRSGDILNLDEEKA